MSSSFLNGSAVNLAGFISGSTVVQNLGPGVMYLDRSSSAVASSGIRVDSGESVTITADGDLYALNQGGDCYVRILTGASLPE